MAIYSIKKVKKFFRKIFGRKDIEPLRLNERYYERCFPPMKLGGVVKKRKWLRIKQKRPPFPSTFVFPDYVYEQWNQDLIDNYGWTKKEIKQGWRWKKILDK